MSDEQERDSFSEEEAEIMPTTEASSPGSMLDEIIANTNLDSEDEGYAQMKKDLGALITQIVEYRKEDKRVSGALVDEIVAELDRKISRQADMILHHPEVQQLESVWRSLKFLVDRTDFRENVKLEILNVTKDELLEDFEDAPEVPQSGLYKICYTAEYGMFGGKPYGAMIGNYDFDASAKDVRLMQFVGSVAAMAHSPFIAAASPRMFSKGWKDFAQLPNTKDLRGIFEGKEYVKWNAFRESEDSRYFGLTLPRFLLRLPYNRENSLVKSFNYEEDVSKSHDDYLWGNAAFAFASRLTDSFADYRWCANIIGPQGGGAVEDLPIHQYEAMGEIQNKIPTEILLSERREFELSEEGFIGLTMRKDSDNAAFFSANSAQKSKYFGISEEGKQAETNYKLGTQLPYMFIINRLAHYIKVIQRENIGTWKERDDLEKELNKWLGQYVADQESPPAGVRSRRPLRKAKIEVEDVEGEPGWYRVRMQVRPHFKYMGAYFTLSLVGKLDKE